MLPPTPSGDLCYKECSFGLFLSFLLLHDARVLDASSHGTRRPSPLFGTGV